MIKKVLVLALAFIITSAQVCCAYNFPKAFFDIQTELDAAVASGDNRGIIDAATRQYNIFSSAPKDRDIHEVTAAKTYIIAEAYEKLGDYENAALWYERAIESNEYLGFTDAVRISKAKSKQFKTELSLYKNTYNKQAYFGAKNEPEIGVLSGIAFDSPTRSVLSNESMILIYHTHGDDFNLYYENFLKEAQRDGKAVEIAYNMSANSASDIGMINMSSSAVSSFADILAKYPDVPMYFRFAGEVNAWDVKPSAEDYKQAFRTVSGIIRSKAPHVAMVYGINFVSSWDCNFTDYYPGDEYVDWVGVSLYCKKQFADTPALTFREKIDDVMFYASDSAQPVLMMDEIVKTFGDRKPIMIFESGATGHTISTGEYSEAWANNRIAKIINYLPMRYPQIKMIGYFDSFVYGENNDYSLKNHSSMKDFYNTQVKKQHIIQGSYSNDNVTAFQNCDNGFSVYQTTDTLSVYAQIYGSDSEKVDYFIDDVWVGYSSSIPYSCSVDFSKCAPGKHVLRYNVTAQNGKIYSKSVGFTVMENIKITVDGAELSGLDQPPVIANGKTLVPVRALFESIGAGVEWDGNTRTVTATRGSDVVKMQIGNKNIYKNGSLYEVTDVSPKTINGRTMIPARIAAEIFGKTVNWNQETKTVIIE